MKRQLLSSDEPSAKRQKIQDIDIVEQFEDIVALYPDKTAISYKGIHITYQALNQKINQLAQWMLGRYCSSDENVTPIHIGIRGSNKLQIIITQLACLKIGAAYVVIDENEPGERVAFIAKDAELDLIINCDEDMASAILPTDCVTTQINLGEFQEQLSNQRKENVSKAIRKQLSISPDSLAYYVYTSGSTGKPKGVMQTRYGLLGQMKYYVEAIDLSADDVFLGLSPLTHDQGLSNVYSSLLMGCTLCLFDLVGNNFQAAVKFIEEQQITVYVSVPTVWEQIAGAATKQALASIKTVRLGGEESKIKHAKLYQAKCSPAARYITVYGASECSFIAINVITHETDLDSLNGTIPMGQILPHIKHVIYTSDDDDVTYPEGGEFNISSPYMAKGYTDNNEHRKSYYVTKQYTDSEGQIKPCDDKYYITGDIVSMKENVLHFVGRAVWHEKISGNRVNLHGIEQVIENKIAIDQVIPGCECVVVAIGRDNEKSLVAFITGQDKDKIDIEKLKVQLSVSLESYAIPHKIEMVESFPLLENRKIDRKKLKQIAEDTYLSKKEKIMLNIHSLSDLLNHMEAIWCLMLNLTYPITAENKDVSFNQLGGDSLCSMATSNFINEIINQCILPKNEIISFVNPSEVHYRNLTMFNRRVDDKIKQYDYFNSNNIVSGGHHGSKLPFAVVSPVFAGNHPWIYSGLYSLSLLNYHAMHNAINYTCHLYGIDIRLCMKWDKLIECIKTIIEAGKMKQYGFIVGEGHSEYSPEEHQYPCILIYNATLAKWCLFIADCCVGMRQASLIQQHFVEYCPDIHINIYVDPVIRIHRNDVSCSVDALYYLENALRLRDYLDNVYILGSKSVDDDLLLFLSPPVCMQGYTRSHYEVGLRSALQSFTKLKPEEINNIINNPFILKVNEGILNNIEHVQHEKSLHLPQGEVYDGDGYQSKEECKKKNDIWIEDKGRLVGYCLAKWENGVKVTEKFFKYDALPDNIVRMTWMRQYFQKDTLYNTFRMLLDHRVFTCPSASSLNSSSSEINTYYYNKSEQLYRICIYGSQLCELDVCLTDYLYVLNKDQVSLKIPGLFNESTFSEQTILQDTLDTVKYLKVLFGLAESHPYTNNDMSKYVKIIFGSVGEKPCNEKLINILRAFIQSLDGTYLFKGQRVEIKDGNDVKSFINLLQEDYQMKHDCANKGYRDVKSAGLTR